VHSSFCIFCSASGLALRRTLFPYTPLFRSVIAAVLMMVFNNFQNVSRGTTLSYSEFITAVGNGQVEKVTISGQTIAGISTGNGRSEEHTSELQSRENLVCRLLLEKKNGTQT